VVCFEGISELAATEIEEEPLWDGQAKSSRYQDFSRSGFIAPQDLANGDAAAFQQAGEALLAAYTQVQQRAFDCLAERLPRPGDMKLDAYRRNIAARAFDVARYLLFWAVPTNVGQVCSIRTLEKQIRRLKASEYGELRARAEELAQACAAERIAVGIRARRPNRSPPRSRATPMRTLTPRIRARNYASGRSRTCQRCPVPRPSASTSCGPPVSQPISWPPCCIPLPTGRSASCTRWPKNGTIAGARR